MLQIRFSRLVGWLHEGHGHGAPGTGESVWHYLTEAEHWPMVAATGIAVAVLLGLAVLTLRFLNRVLIAKCGPNRVGKQRQG